MDSLSNCSHFVCNVPYGTNRKATKQQPNSETTLVKTTLVVTRISYIIPQTAHFLAEGQGGMAGIGHIALRFDCCTAGSGSLATMCFHVLPTLYIGVGTLKTRSPQGMGHLI
jgi:hypothetical protein